LGPQATRQRLGQRGFYKADGLRKSVEHPVRDRLRRDIEILGISTGQLISERLAPLAINVLPLAAIETLPAGNRGSHRHPIPQPIAFHPLPNSDHLSGDLVSQNMGKPNAGVTIMKDAKIRAANRTRPDLQDDGTAFEAGIRHFPDGQTLKALEDSGLHIVLALCSIPIILRHPSEGNISSPDGLQTIL
jgi:hypothetical protein